ncbi:uncharacterized protein EV422DRAFT_566360 [Fimicolochytrium jonesii]|uniref:uncharacterized protein n=1 Tax=Fimicolochytrium jonesii TaxID=1396493 RepID=UPI0022FDEC26|nr:uncharacterized protein EV422DRAFT_566360 [Fimicolochytrium jonesii]KAI8822692.1 hypothetical protein EV422DRAFT_566360 [Fimicolochytrium jonesii]
MSKAEKRPVEEDVDSSDDEAQAPPTTTGKKSSQKGDEFQRNKPLVLLSEEQREQLAREEEEAAQVDADGNPIKKTKKAKKAAAAAKAAASVKTKTGAVYLGRIPHGFYEDEMRGYFTQFGDVTRLRLSRNKKTGASKHFAFIEFASEDAAKIAAETMDGYLLFNCILQCKFVPSDKLHPDIWKGANKKYKPIPRVKIQRELHNKPKTAESYRTTVKRYHDRQDAKRARMAEAGIEYAFPEVSEPIGVADPVGGDEKNAAA